MFYKFSDKKSKGCSITNEPNYRLANDFYKPIIRKLKKRQVYSGFKDNIWGADLADMQLISKFNKGFRCVINILSKCLGCSFKR